MKMIDLLNKRANDEELPKKIKFDGFIYELDKNMNWYVDTKYVSTLDCDYRHINDEVEILEEEKKIPEKLNKQHFHNRQRQLANKINEIIDYLKSKGDE